MQRWLIASMHTELPELLSEVELPGLSGLFYRDPSYLATAQFEQSTIFCCAIALNVE